MLSTGLPSPMGVGDLNSYLTILYKKETQYGYLLCLFDRKSIICVSFLYFSRYFFVSNISFALSTLSFDGVLTSFKEYGIPNSSHLNTPKV